MPRLCIIGNSHLGAIRLGWKALARSERLGWSADFFVVLRGLHTSLSVRNDRLITSNREVLLQFLKTAGRTHIRASRYQAFAIVAFDIAPSTLARKANRFRTWQFAKEGRATLSQRAFEAAVAGSLRESASLGIARKLRTLTTAPIFILPAPQPSADIVANAGDDLAWLAEPAMAQALFTATTSGLAAAAVAGDEGFHAMTQPPETLVPGTPYTRPEFARSAIDGESRPLAPDMFHMGVDYGRIMARALIDACATHHTAVQPTSWARPLQTVSKWIPWASGNASE